MPTDPLMENHAARALTTTKALHKRLRELEDESFRKTHNDEIDWKPLKKLAADANKAVQAMQKHAQDEATRADVRENVLREAVRDELIDREANAARVVEKQRAFLEGQGQLGAYDKALTTANAVEACVAQLCPHQTQRAPGVAQLAAAAGAASR